MQVAPATPFTWSIHRRRTWLDLNTVTTTPGDDPPANAEPHHRSPSEELEWIGAEVEARPKVMFWGTIAVAAIVGITLIVYIIVVITGN